MTSITKDNLTEFMDYYHWFHDSKILDVKYYFKKTKIELYLDVFWSGKPILKNDGTYETNKTVVKMICNDIYQYNFKETYLNDIDDAYLKYIMINEEEYICFATDKEEPLISIVCRSIEYEEVNNEQNL